MLNYFLIRFFGLLACVGLGLDAQLQASRADKPVLEFGVSGYINSISARITQAKAEKTAAVNEKIRVSAWKKPTRDFLPEAPEGWQRRGFDEGDNTSIVPNFNRSLRGGDWSETDDYLSKARKDTSGVSASPTPKGLRNMMKGQSADEFIEDFATRSWVYERGEETVFIEMRLKPASNQKSMAGLAMAEMNSVVSKTNQPAKLFGYSAISGVGFVELRGQSNMVVSADLATHYRIIRAKIGLDEEVQPRVHANASQASTREILHAIDFESMNNLLSMPMPHIRNGHQIPINVTEQDVVNAMSMLYSEARDLLTSQRGFAIRDMFVLKAPKIQIGEKNGQPVFAPIGSGNTEDLRTVIQESYRNSMLLVANGGSYESGKSSLTYNIQDAPQVILAKPTAEQVRELGTMSLALQQEVEERRASLGITGLPSLSNAAT